jgi:hypothetical protein
MQFIQKFPGLSFLMRSSFMVSKFGSLVLMFTKCDI